MTKNIPVRNEEKRTIEKKQGIGTRRRTSKSLYNENEEGNKSFKFGS